MLMIGLLCVIRGGEGRVDMAKFGRSKLEFLRRFMKLKYGIPSREVFSALFDSFDPDGLRCALLRLASSRSERMKDECHRLLRQGSAPFVQGRGVALASASRPRFRRAVAAWARSASAREIKGERTTETGFFPPGSKMEPGAVSRDGSRALAVENSLRRALDTAMNEDAQLDSADKGPEILMVMRRLAPNIARAHPGKDSVRGKLLKAAWRNEFPLDLIRSAVTAPEAKN